MTIITAKVNDRVFNVVSLQQLYSLSSKVIFNYNSKQLINSAKILDTKMLFYLVLDFLYKSEIIAKKAYVINIDSKEGNILFLTKNMNIVVYMNMMKTNFLEF